jgi:hypothetical protein
MAKEIQKGLLPIGKIFNRNFFGLSGSRQGTGSLGLENYKTETIVDTTKMTPEEKAEYLKNFNKK